MTDRRNNITITSIMLYDDSATSHEHAVMLFYCISLSNIYIYIYVYMCVYIYIYISICLCPLSWCLSAAESLSPSRAKALLTIWRRDSLTGFQWCMAEHASSFPLPFMTDTALVVQQASSNVQKATCARDTKSTRPVRRSEERDLKNNYTNFMTGYRL